MSDTDTATSSIADDRSTPAGSWSEQVLRMAPPLASMAAGLTVAVVILHILFEGVILPWQGWDVPVGLLLAADGLVFVGVATYGWLGRRGFLGPSAQAWWDRWEDPTGTMPLVVGLIMATIFLCRAAYDAPQTWAVLALAAVATCAVAILCTGPRRMREATTVVPRGEQPDHPEDYLRVDLACGLDPVVPGVEETVGLWIRKDTVQSFRDLNPQSNWVNGVPKFDRYISEGQCEEINRLADRLAEIAVQRGLDRYLEVVLVMNLVQQIPYMFDIDSKGIQDYWRYPLETVADSCGDCEDFAILSVALLSAMGHETCFFFMPDISPTSSHAALGVANLPEATGLSVEAADGKHYYYVETTSEGWHIGQMPGDFAQSALQVAGVVPPLRSRRQEHVLAQAPRGQWHRDSALVVVSALGMALVGAAVSVALKLIG